MANPIRAVAGDRVTFAAFHGAIRGAMDAEALNLLLGATEKKAILREFDRQAAQGSGGGDSDDEEAAIAAELGVGACGVAISCP